LPRDGRLLPELFEEMDLSLVIVRHPFSRYGNFTNVLRAAFILKDPNSIKIMSSCQYIFVLLGSARVEALLKMLMKLTSGMTTPVTFYFQK